MKKILTSLLIALCALVNIVNAQTVSITNDTVKGGQQLYIAEGTLIIPDSTTVQRRTMWDFSNAFNNISASAWQTVVNASATTDTVFVKDTVAVQITGTIFVRHEVRKIGDTVSYFSGAKPVVIKPIVVSPTIALNSNSPNSTGGTQTVDYHAGFDVSHLKVLLSIGNLTLQNPTLQNAVVNLIDSGTYTWSFGTFPSGTMYSYQFMFYNSVDTVYSGINGMTVLPSNSVSINQVDSFGVTDQSITTRTPVICNSTLVATTHIAYHNQSEFAHFDTTITGNGLVMNLYHTFNGLTAATDYDIWTTFPGTTGAKRMIPTLNTIYTFSITTDSVKTIGTNVRVYGTATVPSGEVAMVGGMRAAANDINFNIALEAPPMFQVTQGQFHVYQDFDFSTATANVNSRYKMYGYLINGGQYHGAGIQHLYVVPTDTVKPLITTFDSTDVNATNVITVFTGIDTGNLSTGVTNFLLYRNNTLVATLLGTQSTYTFTGLTANTTYVLGIQAKDGAGKFSLLQTMEVTTDATATVPTPANLTSIDEKVCFDGNGTWGLVTIYGTNIQPGSNYSGEYYDGVLPDVDSVMDVNSTGTECKAWIFVAAHFPLVTFTITNPGASVSNAISTKVDDCTATGIADVTRTNRKLLKSFPNPFIDVTTIEVGQNTDYIIVDYIGNLVQSGKFTVGINQIDLHEQSKGFYIVRTSTGLNTKIVKL